MQILVKNIGRNICDTGLDKDSFLKCITKRKTDKLGLHQN